MTDKIEVQEAEPKSPDGSLSHKEEQHLSQLPPGVEPHSGVDAKKQRKRRRRCCCCCVSCVVAVIIVALIVVILALTVFKAKEPKITVNSAKIDGLSARVDLATGTIHVNLTLISDISLKNPNMASFKHSNSTSLMLYRGKTVGQALIPAGEIKADRTVRLNVSVTVYVDAFVSSGSNLITDAISGSLPLTARTEMSGRVDLLHIIKKHVKVFSSCDINVNVSTASAEVQHCSQSFKL